MKRVTGIGGIFFTAKEPEKLRAWYRDHLGIDVADWGGAAFDWKTADNPDGTGTTAWCVFASDANVFGQSTRPFMINYRVENLVGLLELLRSEGCQVEDAFHEDAMGKFGWVMDPEGNRVELWEPPPGQ